MEFHSILTIERAVNLKKIKTLWSLKPSVTCSIIRDGTATVLFQTIVDNEGGVNPTWNCSGELVFLASHFTMMTDYILLEITHNDKILGKRFIGQANLSLQQLFAHEGIDKAIPIPVTRSGKKAGEIIISYKTQHVVSQVLPD